MARREKKKSRQDSSSSTNRRQPKIVEDVADSDDEEIDEDEAFNSEDERLYGHFFNNSSKVRGNQEEDEDEITSDDGESGDDDDEDDDEEDDDGGQYMLSLLEKLDNAGNGAKKEGKTAAQMTKISESEYSSSISKKELTMDSLMQGLENTQGFKNLQKTFAKKQQATPAPMDKVKADRAARKVAYESQSKNISRWTKVVQENRQAETLDFKPKERLNITRDTLVDKFEATTDFERELEEALEEAGQKDEEAVLKAEEEALQDDLGANRLTMEEYKKRRGQLAQVRALMFYHEQKRHHIKKIKSKKYRKIRKRQRERLKDSALEAAMEEDEELAKELKEKEEVSRIQERMTLAHKNTSKWAKRVLKRGKNVDVETRRALSAQLKRGDDLRKKMIGEDSEGSNSDSDEDLIESARKVLADTDDANDPTQGKTGLFKLSFMQKGIQKQRDLAKEEARKLLSELEANEMDDFESEFERPEEPEVDNKSKKMASDAEMKKVLQTGDLVAKDLAFGNSSSIATSGGIEITLDTESKKTKGRFPLKKEADESRVLSVNGAAIKRKVHTDDKEQVEERTKKNATVAPNSTPAEHDTNPWMKNAEATESSITKSKKASSGLVDVAGAIELLDGGKDAEKSPSDKVATSGTTHDGEKKITMLSQEELIKRAFATQSEKDVDDDFEKEKEAMILENDPTRKVDQDSNKREVAGWGSWTGTGAPPPPPRKKLPKKLQAPNKKDDGKRKRKDDDKKHVIINQKRIKRLANNYMLGDVPHPYKSRAEYEQAMMGGVGTEWNVTSSFKNMTRPEIMTRAGKIILPISKKAKVARAPAKF